MFSWAFKEDIYDYMDPCYRCPHLKTICRPCPERAIALAATGKQERWFMWLCHDISRKAGDLYELKARADAVLGVPSEEEVATALARSN
jgi:hypothetical protein